MQGLRDQSPGNLVVTDEQTRREGPMEDASHAPSWTTLNEGDVLITNVRNGDGSLAVQVLNDMLVPVQHPYRPHPKHSEPMGHKTAAAIPLATGLWRKVYDGPSGWRRD